MRVSNKDNIAATVAARKLLNTVTTTSTINITIATINAATVITNR